MTRLQPCTLSLSVDCHKACMPSGAAGASPWRRWGQCADAEPAARMCSLPTQQLQREEQLVLTENFL